jgi:hypothetical protein
LPAIVGSILAKPVTVPPGRSRRTRCRPDRKDAKMIGMVRVCCSKVAVLGVPRKEQIGLQRDEFLHERPKYIVRRESDLP